MLNKRTLKTLEGILALIIISATKSKRQTAFELGISVDTVSSYIIFLENEVGYCLVSHKNHFSDITSKGKELIAKFKPLYSSPLGDENKKINLFELKTLRSVFYLKALEQYKNKRNTMHSLSTSIETINHHIERLEKIFQAPITISNNHGSFITPLGENILDNFNLLLETLEHNLKKGVINTKIRLAVTNRVNFSSTNISHLAFHHLVFFNDDPNLHSEDWDIVITYSKPYADDVNILFQREVPCGFFASSSYLQHFGWPENIDDIIQNHNVLDSNNLPYANTEYRNFLKRCKKIHNLGPSNVFISEAARFGVGICILPFTSKVHDLVHLDYLSCNIEASLYLASHKKCASLSCYHDAIETYKRIIMDI